SRVAGRRWNARPLHDRGARRSATVRRAVIGADADVCLCVCAEAGPMKWSTMTSRERRTVTIGALVLLPALLYIWAVRPYQTALSEAREQLLTERATLARERAAIATARQNPELQHIADSAMRAMRPRLFEGKDDVMASSELT